MSAQGEGVFDIKMMKMMMKKSSLGGGLSRDPQVPCLAEPFLALRFKSCFIGEHA